MFPNKKGFFNRPDGWEDLGAVEGTSSGNRTISYKAHALCMTTLHVGKEANELFRFCPRCLVKVNGK